MNARGRSQLAIGAILIALGVWFLLDNTLPAFHTIFSRYMDFPFNMFLIGAVMFIFGLMVGRPGLSVPAAIIAGLGGIFYFQEFLPPSASWTGWVLIPGFVGVGIILQGLLGESTAYNLKRGVHLVVVSAIIFLVLSSIFGGWKMLGDFGAPILLIFLGLWVLGSGFYRTLRGYRG